MSYSCNADAKVIRAFTQEDSEEAFESLVQRYGPMVYAICLRMLNNHADAEDATQAVFITLARKACSLNGERPLAGWLHRVAYRLSIDLLRKRKLQKSTERKVSTHPDRADENIEQDTRSPVFQALDRAIAELPEKYRLPILLHHVEGMTQHEVAQKLGLNYSTVTMRLTRARDVLRARLKQEALYGSIASLLALYATRQHQAVLAESFIGDTARLGTLAHKGKLGAGSTSKCSSTVKYLLATEARRNAVRALYAVALLLGLCGLYWGLLRELRDTIQSADANALSGPVSVHNLETIQARSEPAFSVRVLYGEAERFRAGETRLMRETETFQAGDRIRVSANSLLLIADRAGNEWIGYPGARLEIVTLDGMETCRLLWGKCDVIVHAKLAGGAKTALFDATIELQAGYLQLQCFETDARVEVLKGHLEYRSGSGKGSTAAAERILFQPGQIVQKLPAVTSVPRRQFSAFEHSWEDTNRFRIAPTLRYMPVKSGRGAKNSLWLASPEQVAPDFTGLMSYSFPLDLSCKEYLFETSCRLSTQDSGTAHISCSLGASAILYEKRWIDQEQYARQLKILTTQRFERISTDREGVGLYKVTIAMDGNVHAIKYFQIKLDEPELHAFWHLRGRTELIVEQIRLLQYKGDEDRGR